MVEPGPKPHVGGVVQPKGDPTVLIANQPAARQGDSCACMGPTDMITTGAATVLIGGAPAARVGDTTAHGGSIVAGCPTVKIGSGGQGASFKSASAPLVERCEDPKAPPMV
jgi:uncharacterized Zn-binding protein involved in type VI secretion